MHSRKKKLIRPGLQLRLVLTFLCAAALSVQAQAIMLAFTLSRLADYMPSDGARVLEQLPEFIVENVLLGLAILVPVTLGVGLFATFRIAGPIYRFEQFLRAVRDGQQVEPCRLRKGDELMDLCELLNEVTAPLRARAAGRAPNPDPSALHSVAPAIPHARESVETHGASAGLFDRPESR